MDVLHVRSLNELGSYLLGLGAGDPAAELRGHHVEVPDLGHGPARHHELPGGAVGLVLVVLGAVLGQVRAPSITQYFE